MARTPARAPANAAMPQASQGFQPDTISTAATAPPSGKLPSAVRSGKSSTRNEIHTPSATSAKMRPISSAPMNEIMDMVGTSLSGRKPAPIGRPVLGEFHRRGRSPQRRQTKPMLHAQPTAAAAAPSPHARRGLGRPSVYLMTSAASLTSASDSFTPCFWPAPGFTTSDILAPTSVGMAPGLVPFRMRSTTLPVWRPRS